jgi:hypothetical protein
MANPLYKGFDRIPKGRQVAFQPLDPQGEDEEIFELRLAGGYDETDSVNR